MFQRTLIGVLGLCLTLTVVTTASATSLTIDSITGRLLGATGVDVDGTLYDVQFLDGSCVTVFTGCNDPSDFAFTDPAAAEMAANALISQVLIDGAEGFFDYFPERTNGCSHTQACIVLIPTGLAGTVVSGPTVVNPFQSSDIPKYLSVFEHPADTDMATLTHTTWAKFTPSATPVPEPGSILLLGTGGAALLVKLRRRRKATE